MNIINKKLLTPRLQTNYLGQVIEHTVQSALNTINFYSCGKFRTVPIKEQFIEENIATKEYPYKNQLAIELGIHCNA